MISAKDTLIVTNVSMEAEKSFARNTLMITGARIIKTHVMRRIIMRKTKKNVIQITARRTLTLGIALKETIIVTIQIILTNTLSIVMQIFARRTLTMTIAIMIT